MIHRNQTLPQPWLNWLFVALLICGAAVFLKKLSGSVRSPNTTSEVATDSGQSSGAATSEAASADDQELRPLPPGEAPSTTRLPQVLQTVARTPPVQPSGPRVEASPDTRQLVSTLTNLDLSKGPLSAEQAQQWKQSLNALAAQGAAAVPAIREFLDLNKEVVFGSDGGRDLLGQSSMRSAFINTLAQIGGSEATAALVQTLQTSTLPAEIAQLSQILDQRAPGQYRQEALTAINEVLNMASNGQLPPDWDMGVLFKTLQNFGDSSTASALAQLQGPYKYYSTMALAELQGGEGVTALVQETQGTSAAQRDFAYQMLAQVAADFPDAGAALLEKAKANQISDSAWVKIATGLAGDQYQIGEPPQMGRVDPASIVGLKTFHIGSGNQNFYSLPLDGNAQIQQRLALVDELAGATSSPAALSALQASRATLNTMMSK